MSPDRLTFIHIPKTGGTSLTRALIESYPPEDSYPGRFFEHFDRLGPEALGRYRLFAGHMGFEQARRIGGGMVTVLRDPVDRVVSLHSFFNGIDERLVAQDRGALLARRLTLEEFARSSDPDAEAYVLDAQTWQLAFDPTVPTRHRWRHLTGEELLGVALRNLARMEVVGLFEELDRAFERISRRFRLPEAARLPHFLRTPGRPRLRDIPEETRRLIADRVGLDLRLYEEAADRLGVAAEGRRSGGGLPRFP